MLSYLFSKLNKITENRKERLNRKRRKKLPVAQAKSAHPSPAGPKGHGGLLPCPAPPSCSVECHRASWARHVAAGGFQASSWPLLASWRRLAAATFISLPPKPPPSLRM